MRFLSVVSLLLAVASASPPPEITPAPRQRRFAAAPVSPHENPLDKRGSCNANNCARAVTGTRSGKMPDVSSRMADCSSFQLTTVYTYNHLTIVASSSVPTAVPSYASACSTPVSPQSAYASACSCWGILPAYTTTTASYDPTCTNPADVTECNANLPGWGAVPTNLRLVSCPVAIPDQVTGCSCQTDTEGRGFCDSGWAGFYYKACSSSADCAPDERCNISPCAGGSSCERTAPGFMCNGGAQIFP